MTKAPFIVLPKAEPESLPKGAPTAADLDRKFKAELKRLRKNAKRLETERLKESSDVH